MPRLPLHECLYFYYIIILCASLVFYSCVFFCYLVSNPSCLPCIVLDFHMLTSSLPHIGFAYGASHSTQNLEFAAWEIYAPTNELISLNGVCLSHATKNIVEYSTFIKLLVDAISIGICHLVV
jgi:hypothetical protein